MHSRISGSSDFLALDEHDAIRQARRVMARLNWRKKGTSPDRVVRTPSRTSTPRSCST